MKVFKYLAIVFAGVYFFTACQKELSIEQGSPATGSLKDTSGNCLPVTVAGRYRVDSALTDSDFVTLQVRFSTPGSYTIATDSSNGFSYKASGFTTDTGMQSIRLTGSGKPAVAQQTNFSVAFDTSVCTFSIDVTKDSAVGTAAIYTLAGSPGNCSNSIVNGTYRAGTRLDMANYVSIQVNLTVAGSYSISTGTTNGMTFSAQGNFTATGVQTVILQGSGTPVAAGTNTIPVTAGTGNCSFIISVITAQNTSTNNADSAWQFSQGTNFYHGPFADVFDTTVANVGYIVEFVGYTRATRDTVLIMQVKFPGSTIKTGTYNTTASGNGFYYAKFVDAAGIYTADAGTPGSDMQITISAYNPLSKMITGTFSGTALYQLNTPVPITGGKFKAVVR